MEELRKLEQVQKVIQLMQSRGLVSTFSSNHNSTRFLANLTLLLVQPCGELDFDEKLSLVSEYIPKISSSFIEEASNCICYGDGMGRENNNSGCAFDTSQSYLERNVLDKADHERMVMDTADHERMVVDTADHERMVMDTTDHERMVMDTTDHDRLLDNYEDLGLVGLDAMQRANSTLEDFCRSYFMFHGMDINQPGSLFKYLPLIAFTESYIYQLDTLNEKMLTAINVPVLAKGYETEINETWILKFVETNKNDLFRPLTLVLERNGLLTERIGQELKSGEEYWALERKLCCALVHKHEISVEDVMRAIHLKSFDFRVLNLLLYQLRGEEVNDLHMEFLTVSEFLVEVSDDLFDYEDDVLENTFNVLRMFVRIFGPSTAPAMLAKYITEAEEKYDNLLKTLDPKLSSNYQKRCEEATKEGGKISGHPFGTWNIPPLIVDEELYRSKIVNEK